MTFRKFLIRLLPRTNFAFRVARAIVNRHEGDNDIDIETNGELRVMRSVLPHCRVVFDVGANVGDWTSFALRIAPAAQIHCFEPSSATFAALSARSFPAGVRRNHFGLGRQAEEKTMFVYADGAGSNSLYLRIGLESQQGTREEVVIRTLDDYCATESIDEVDFVKIDVEGHELSVLLGAERMLRAGKIGVLQFEYGGSYIDSRTLMKDVWEFVESMKASYAFFKIFPQGPRLVTKYKQTLETFQYSNWLLVRADWIGRVGAAQPR